MEQNAQSKALNESISNADLPGDANDARTPQSTPSAGSGETEGTLASNPPTIKDGQGRRPSDEASTMGHSDAPKVPPTPPASDVELPDPKETGEAG